MAFRSAVGCALLFATAAVAQAPHRSPTTMDVAGVRLGMTPVEAKTALIAAGYRITAENKGESYESGVRRAADGRLGRPYASTRSSSTASIDGIGPRRESVMIRFDQHPAGPKVGSVDLTIPREAMTADDFVGQAIARWGKPGLARFNQQAMFWCSREVGTNCGRDVAVTGPHWSHYPSLRTEAYFDPRIWLDVGMLPRRDLERQREAAIETLAPKTKRAAF